MKKMIGLLLMIVGTTLYGMEEGLLVKVPKKSRTHDKARTVLLHAGCSENNVKVQALLAAFKKMEEDPSLTTPQPSETDGLADVGTSEKPLSTFEHLKQLWHSYHQTAKEVKRTDDAQLSQQKILSEQRRQNAQNVIDKALELFNDQQNAAVTSHKRQKYVIAGIAVVGYLLSVGIGAYMKYTCDQTCSRNSM